MSVEHAGVTFERLGHASVRIEGGDGTVIYVDPWSDVLSEKRHDGDVIFVTHEDFDHYDPDGIEAVRGADATIALYEAIDTDELEQVIDNIDSGRRNVDVVALPYDGETTVDGITVRTVPAYNDPDGEHVFDEGQPFHGEGEVIGLLLTIDDTRIYYPSDTDFLPEHEGLDVDVFLPPIGGHYTMDRHEAARFALHLLPELVLPVHYDTFEAIETDAEAFAEELSEAGILVELF